MSRREWSYVCESHVPALRSTTVATGDLTIDRLVSLIEKRDQLADHLKGLDLLGFDIYNLDDDRGIREAILFLGQHPGCSVVLRSDDGRVVDGRDHGPLT